MHLATPRFLLCLASLALLLGFVLAAPSQHNVDAPTRIDGLLIAAAALRGDGPREDFASDVVGAKALINGTNAYPVLGPQLAKIGLSWRLKTVSTHPPTSFLLALPVAKLRWRVAGAIWAWLTVACFVVTIWALGARWTTALTLGPLLLLWPPAAWSLGQLTALAFLGQSLAWRWRSTHLKAAGAAIGLATITKIVPALLLLPLLLRRRWQVLVGFCGVVALSVIALLALNAGSIDRYLTAGRRESRLTIERGDNGALFPFLYHRNGALGVAGGVFVVALVLWRRRFGWDSCIWLSVALLPIAWIYSLLPLAAVVVSLLREKRFFTSAIAIAAVVLSTISAPFGDAAASRESQFVVLIGVALALTRRGPEGTTELRQKLN